MDDYFEQMSEAKEKDLRMAVGFLDSPLLAEKTKYKVFVGLVALTHPSIQNTRKFEIPVTELKKEIGWTTNNYEWLDNSIEWLMATVLTYNKNRIDNNGGWDKTQILGPSSLRNGVLKIEWTEPVWEKLKNPIVYAYITKRGVYDFKSKYSILMYNWLIVQMVPNKSQEIVHKSIEEILSILNIKDKKQASYYSSYSRLNDKILTPVRKEINKLSNISFKLSTSRKGKSVNEVTFIIKKSTPEFIEAKYTHAQGASEEAKEERISSNEPSLELKRVMKRMKDMGLSLTTGAGKQIQEAVTDLGEKSTIAWLEEIVSETEYQLKLGKIENVGGYLRKKLQNRPLFDFSDLDNLNADAENKEKQEAFSKYAKYVSKGIKSHVDSKNTKFFSLWLEKNWETKASPAINKIISDGDFLLEEKAKGLRVDLSNKDSVLKRLAFVSILSTVYREAFPIDESILYSEVDISTEERSEILEKSAQSIILEPEYKKYLAKFQFAPTIKENSALFWDEAVSHLTKA